MKADQRRPNKQKMNRRTFLKATGGLATSVMLSPAVLGPAASQIKHIIVVMMENRSFNRSLGWLPNANGRQAGLSAVCRSQRRQPSLAQASAGLDRLRLP